MSDIFVSYKRAQQVKARQLVSALAARGWDVWWDWNIPTGNDWKAELDRELDAAGCVLVLWTRDSAQSEWVLYEARHAQSAGKLVQALLEPGQAPPEFATRQAVDLSDWEYGTPFHGGFDKLRVGDPRDPRSPRAARGDAQRYAGPHRRRIGRPAPARRRRRSLRARVPRR